jgi:hypothetical protein
MWQSTFFRVHNFCFTDFTLSSVLHIVVVSTAAENPSVTVTRFSKAASIPNEYKSSFMLCVYFELQQCCFST